VYESQIGNGLPAQEQDPDRLVYVLPLDEQSVRDDSWSRLLNVYAVDDDGHTWGYSVQLV
jgi:hypothetical protein